MKLLSLLFLFIPFTNTFAQETNCIAKDKYASYDIMYCNENLGYKVPVLISADIPLSKRISASQNEIFIYTEEAVRLSADENFDSRFYYEPSSTEPGTIDLIYPTQDGEFFVYKVFVNNKKFVFVHWADIDDGSFSILFEDSNSYKPIYSVFEN